MVPFGIPHCDPATFIGTSNSTNIPVGFLVDDLELSLAYKVDSLLPILTKFVSIELRYIFEIPNDICILLSNGHLIPNNPSLKGLPFFLINFLLDSEFYSCL